MENTIIGVVMAVFGIGLMLLAWRSYSTKKGAADTAASTWRSADARLTACEVSESLERDSENDLVTVLRPAPRYAFAVNGREYEGARAYLVREQFDSPKQANAWAAAYPAGGAAKVWYDPADPAQCALEIDKPSLTGAVFTMAIGAVFLAIGLVALLQ
jgi:hypothetical protein